MGKYGVAFTPVDKSGPFSDQRVLSKQKYNTYKEAEDVVAMFMQGKYPMFVVEVVKFVVEPEPGDAYEDVAAMQKKLEKTILPWREDGFMPSNFIRKDGLGRMVATVSRWCGGFQSPHKPHTVGWCATHGSHHQSGVVVIPDEYRGVEQAVLDAMNKCRREADEWLEAQCGGQFTIFYKDRVLEDRE